MTQQAKSPETSKMVEKEKIEPPRYYGPEEAANDIKSKGAREIETAMPNSEKTESKDPDTEYKPVPFPKDILKKKSKGYPEINVDKKTKDIVDELERIFKKNRKNEDMDHGDTQSGIWEDEHEYVLLHDKTNKPKTRLFKSNDKKSA